MSLESQNTAASNPNTAHTETEHVLIVPTAEGAGSILMNRSEKRRYDVDVNEYPTDREILAAMVSELCAECVRVTGMGGVGVWFWYCASTEMVSVHAGYKGQDIHAVMNEYMRLGQDDAADRLADLIKRVGALGAEG